MKKAAAYIRVSTNEQTEYSPGSQLRAISEYAKKHQLQLLDTHIYTDEGISGRTADKRVEFQRMITAAKTVPPPFSVILVWKYSRFARSREDSILYKSMLKRKCGIDVISVSETIGEDKTSVLIEAIIEAMDEYYSINLSEEVRRGMNEKFRRGGVVSPPPLGYRCENGIFMPDTANRSFIEKIFTDYANGKSLRKIATEMNSMHITTSRGNPFEVRSIEYILKNPVYIGKARRRLTENGEFEVTASNHEAIISEELFDAVQGRISRDKKPARANNSATLPYLTKGLAFCGSCGASLVSASDSRYLQCSRYSRGLCSVSHCISKKKLNKLICDKIISDLSPLEFSAERLRSSTEHTVLKQLILKEERRLSRSREAFLLGIDSADEYKVIKSDIEKRLSDYRLRLSALDSYNSDTQKKYSYKLDLLTSADFGEEFKNALLHTFIHAIYFDKAPDGIRIYYS